MKVQPSIGYLVGSVASVGASQMIGAMGLVTFSSKIIYDKIRKLNSDNIDQNKIYSKKIKNDKKILRNSVLLLIPFWGIPLVVRYGNKGGKAFGEEVSGISENTKNFLNKTTLKALYPLEKISADTFIKILTRQWQTPEQSYQEFRKRVQARFKLNGESLEIPTQDGRKIEGVWLASKKMNANASAAVIFHGRDGTLDFMYSQAQFFYELGMNVLLITIGGYPNSNEGQEVTPRTTYLDAEAAVQWIKENKNLPNERIVAYGLSLGASLACHAASKNPGVHLITDQAFTDTGSVIENLLPDFIAPILQGCVQTVEEIPDNIEKIKRIRGNFLGLYTTNDLLMTTWRGKNLTESLAEIYVLSNCEEAKEPVELSSEIAKITVSYPGLHGRSFRRIAGKDSPEPRMIEHLKEIKLIR